MWTSFTSPCSMTHVCGGFSKRILSQALKSLFFHLTFAQSNGLCMSHVLFIWFLNFLHLHIHVHVQRTASSKLIWSLTIAWMGFRMCTISAYWIFLYKEIWEVVNQKKNGNSLQSLWWERHGPCPCSQTWLKGDFKHLKQSVSSVGP